MNNAIEEMIRWTAPVRHFMRTAPAELRSLFRRIVPLIGSVELAGTPTTMQTTFVGGHKTLPIRYTLREEN